MKKYWLITDGDKFAIKCIGREPSLFPWCRNVTRYYNLIYGYCLNPDAASWLDKDHAVRVMRSDEENDALLARRAAALAGRP